VWLGASVMFLLPFVLVSRCSIYHRIVTSSLSVSGSVAFALNLSTPLFWFSILHLNVALMMEWWLLSLEFETLIYAFELFVCPLSTEKSSSLLDESLP
jgi:hypothetical protein